jgi:glutamine amidotransferase
MEDKYNLKKKICIIDYGMGNIHSVYNSLVSIGITPFITNKKEELEKADGFILPGVGAFPKAMSNLNKLNLIDEIKKQVLIKNKNILGICLGMQLFADSSEEGNLKEGLSLIPGRVVDLAKKVSIRVPHIGWNSLNIYDNSSIFKNIINLQDFYFVHRFYFDCDTKYILASTDYEIDITAAIKYKNIYGVQFHPERSHNMGIKLINNFINL